MYPLREYQSSVKSVLIFFLVQMMDDDLPRHHLKIMPRHLKIMGQEPVPTSNLGASKNGPGLIETGMDLY